MQPDMFYEIQNAKAIPLYLLSQREWEQGLETLSTKERNCFATQQFKGKLGELCLLNDEEGLVSKAYVGTGEGNQALALANAAIRLPAACYEPQQALSHTANVSWSLAQYRFSDYKKQECPVRTLIVNEANLEAIIAEARAIFLVRDLINTPTNDLGPEELAIALANIRKEFNAEYHQWMGNELLVSGFYAIHAVGRASAKAPRLININWGNEEHPHITIIGKGVCFDSGGLDIKPSPAMRLMKKDMGGAAHAMGLAQWIMARKLPVYLQVFIPAVENAIGPDSFRPGDVITMHNGLTVEIDNTDAEGRLVLADAIAKACESKPDLLIDFATLTGAARVAVGTEIAAMFSNNDQLAQAITDSAVVTEDPVWRLPLFAAYEPLLDSSVADLVNSSPSPYAGAITAALFLQRFIPKSLPWVHFDIMAWNLSSKPGKPEGGEAMALRAMMHYLWKTYGNKPN